MTKRGMEMVSSLPRLGTMQREGSPFTLTTLSYSSSSPWLFPHSPIGGKQCGKQDQNHGLLNNIIEADTEAEEE